MPMGGRFNRTGLLLVAGGTALLLTVVGFFAYVHRDTVLVYYYSQRCLQSHNQCATSKEWLLKHNHLALPIFIQTLKSGGKPAETAGQVILEFLSQYGDPTDPEHVHLCFGTLAQLREHWDELSLPGCLAAVRIAQATLERHLVDWSPNVPSVLTTAGEVLLFGLRHSEAEVRLGALAEVAAIWGWEGASDVPGHLVRDWKRRCYQAITEALQDADPAVRKAGAEALAGCPFHERDAWLAKLIEEPDPAVAAAALVALRTAGLDALSARQRDLLLQDLHAIEPPLADAARQVLLHAGYDEVALAILTRATHPDPEQRTKILRELLESKQESDQRWAVKLSYDPAAAVRVLFAQAAPPAPAEFRERLVQLADTDPDEGVRTAARKTLGQSTASRDLGNDR